MSPGLGEIVVKLLSVLSAGLAVKIMDDDQDREVDELLGRSSLVKRLGPSALPYGLALLCISLILNRVISGSLFIASYALGMADGSGDHLISGVPAWLESLLFISFGILTLGTAPMVTAFLLVMVIILFDDYRDLDKDQWQTNYVRMLTPIGALLVACFAVILAGMADFEKTLIVLSGAVLLEFCFG